MYLYEENKGAPFLSLNSLKHSALNRKITNQREKFGPFHNIIVDCLVHRKKMIAHVDTHEISLKSEKSYLLMCTTINIIFYPSLTTLACEFMNKGTFKEVFKYSKNPHITT